MMKSDSNNLDYDSLALVIKTCAKLHLIEPHESFTQHCYTTLRETFCHTHLTSECFQVDPFIPLEQTAPSIEKKWFPFAAKHIPEHPYFPRMATKLLPDISTTEKEQAYRIFIKTPLYNEFYAEIGGSSQMWIGLRHENELLINMLYRDRPYGEKEFSMMQLLQPHLESAWNNWKRCRTFKRELEVLREAVFQTPEEEAEAALLRKRIDTLSPRRREVMELVTDGLDNQQIADELGISVLTVKRHLQMIFQSMDIQHRTQLAAQWRRAHCVRLY